MRIKNHRVAARLISAAALMWLSAVPTRAEEVQIEFESSFDKSTQLAAAYVPEDCKSNASPLLVVAHCFGADRKAAKSLGYYEEAENRGWLVVCPELHGHRTAGATSFAAIEAQRDLIDAIDWMSAHYRVDRSRVYLVGRSMGGMLAALMAAKYPDRFACVVAGQGISDFVEWTRNAPATLREAIKTECLALTGEVQFDYERRSAIRYAPNFRYVPLIVWHGSNDSIVPSEQSARLVDAIRKFYPWQEPVHWLHGAGHNPINFPPRWECEQMELYVNTSDARMTVSTRFYPELSLVADESRATFWLTIDPAGDKVFAEVTAGVKDNTLTVRAVRTKRVAVDVEKLPRGIVFNRYSVTSDGTLDLAICRSEEPIFTESCEKEKSGEVPSAVWAPAGVKVSP